MIDNLLRRCCMPGIKKAETVVESLKVMQTFFIFSGEKPTRKLFEVGNKGVEAKDNESFWIAKSLVLARFEVLSG